MDVQTIEALERAAWARGDHAMADLLARLADMESELAKAENRIEELETEVDHLKNPWPDQLRALDYQLAETQAAIANTMLLVR